MCARLKVLVSSRHNGPALIAVSTSSMAEKAVPISTVAVSVPGLGIRFNDMTLRLTDGTVVRQLRTSWIVSYTGKRDVSALQEPPDAHNYPMTACFDESG